MHILVSKIHYNEDLQLKVSYSCNLEYVRIENKVEYFEKDFQLLEFVQQTV